MNAATAATPIRQRLLRQIAPALLLFLLALLFGEYLLGNLKVSELYYLPFIAPLYGAGAIVIREVARRAGRAYGMMLTLGIAYALFEEGLVDQMLFNAAYFDGPQETMDTLVPALGMDAWLTLVVVAMHAVWSITIPIMLVEAIFPERWAEPWLGRAGLVIVGAILALGSAWLCYTIAEETGFFASPPELAGTAVAIAVIVVAAYAIGSRPLPAVSHPPNPWIAGGTAFVASSFYMLTESLPGWTKVVACLAIAAAFLAIVFQWSRRPGWSPVHALALAGGGILTYAWLGAFMEPETGPKAVVDHVGTALLVALVLWLLLIATRNLRKVGPGIDPPEPRSAS